MSIEIYVFILLVAFFIILLIMAYFIRRKLNELMKKLDNGLMSISSELSLYTGKVSSEPKSINDSNSIENKFFTSILAFIRDINACVVFFTIIMSAVLFFLAKTNGLENSTFNNITLIVFFIVGWLPSLVLLIKLINEAVKKRGWKAAGFLIIVFIVTIIIFSLLNFSLEKLIPEVMKILKDN